MSKQKSLKHNLDIVTRFELDLAPGVKASKVTNISRDLARSMSMASVRVVEVIPGKPYIGIEVPNSSREMVRLIELLETPAFRDPNGLLSMAMGKDISGNPVITDLGKAPHMLVAGTTGSGKSVAVNSMILSMLLKYTPDQLRLILIDPKQLELANYNDIPHLLTPVVTDMKDAVSALNWCVNEMERRYKLMSFLKIRKLADYNRKVEEAIANGEDLIDPTWKASDSATQERAPRLQPLPSIVIVADEFADMIMQVGKKAEEMITRLAQKSRAAGIHLLLATQRPSVDVITGLIKANIPTRVALRVNSKIDSRTILDGGGAEDLLGHGDMLFLEWVRLILNVYMGRLFPMTRSTGSVTHGVNVVNLIISMKFLPHLMRNRPHVVLRMAMVIQTVMHCMTNVFPLYWKPARYQYHRYNVSLA